MPGGGPSVTSWGANRLDVFVEGAADRALWHTYWTGSSWSTWESLGGAITSDPDCVSRGPNLIDCFARGTDNAVWSIYFDGSAWGPWFSLGGAAASGPTVASTSADNLEVFVKGTDNALYHQAWTGASGWGAGWESLGEVGVMNSDPDCVSPKWYSLGLAEDLNIINCVARDSSNHLELKELHGGSWHPFQAGAGVVPTDFVMLSGPTVTSWCTDHNKPDCDAYGTEWNIFAQGADGALWHVSSGIVAPAARSWEKIVPSTTTTTSATSTTPSTSATTSATSATSTTSQTVTTSTSTEKIVTTMSTTSTASQSSTSNSQVTVFQTQTVTSQQTTPASTPEVFGILEQNSLLVMAALGVLVLLIAVVAKRRGGKPSSSPPATERTKFFRIFT